MSMQAYLINLDHRTDRLAVMQAQLGAQGVVYRRIAAVNGLGAADIGYPASHARLSKPEYACYLSHVKCWKALLASGAERCLIMEDDLALGPDFKTCLEQDGFFNHDGCVTRLECRPYRTVVTKTCLHKHNGTRLRRKMTYDGGTGAYVITRAYAAYLLKHHSLPEIPVDDQVLNPDEIGLRPHIVYQLDPAPATQRLFLNTDSALYSNESDLEKGRIYPSKTPKHRGALQSVKAFFKGRVQNGRHNLFGLTKVVPFSGEK